MSGRICAVSRESHHELDLPEGVHDAEGADEILRAWTADGRLHVVFDPERE